MKYYKTGGLHDVTIPHNRIVKYGGFLPFMLPILAGLPSVGGITAGTTTVAKNIKEGQLADARRAAIGQAIGRHYRGRRLGSCAGNPLIY